MRYLLAVLSALVVSTAASAQPDEAERGRWGIDLRGGFILPTGDQSALDAEIGAAGSLRYVSPGHVLVFANLDWGTLSAGILRPIAPELGVLNYYLAVGYDLAAESPALLVAPFAGVGLTTFYLTDADAERHWLTVDAGLKVTYWFADAVGLVAQGGVAWPLTNLSEDGGDADLLVPLSAGLAFRF